MPEVASPGRSSRCPSEVSRDSSISTGASSSAARPAGTLMKEIQFQFACSVSSPPASGPIDSASEETPAQMPIAVPRWRGGKLAVMIDSVAGFISAAPRPSDARRVVDQHLQADDGSGAVPEHDGGLVAQVLDQPPHVVCVGLDSVVVVLWPV